MDKDSDVETGGEQVSPGNLETLSNQTAVTDVTLTVKHTGPAFGKTQTNL